MSYAARPGVGWMCHLPPLHRSARVSGLEPVRLSPTAVQTVLAGQATAAKKISWPPPGLGVAWTRQVRPFHRSARVASPVRVGTRRPPTAVHADGEVHDTESRNHPPPGGFGVGWMRHLLPSHRSASVPSAGPMNGLP